ncbi:hypothetical protein HDU93_004094, partial [Gonapodya sp. JEL0774]
MSRQEWRMVTEFERELSQGVGQAILEKGGRDRFFGLALDIGALLDEPSTSQIGAAIFLSLWKSCRNIGWNELSVSLRAKNARYLPDTDQAAVAMEMSTTQSSLKGMFELSSLELAPAMSAKLRREARVEELREHIELGSESNSKDDFSFVEKGKDLMNSFIFVYPVILDILMVSFLGSGIFYTDRLDASMENHVSITLLVCFPVMGALSNS